MLVALITLLVLLIGAAGGDLLLLGSRIKHVSVDFPPSDEGTTWVLVGSDSRASLPPGPDLYGTTADSPGANADAVIVVHVDGATTTALSIPRDLLVSPQPGEISRLTLTLDQGAQSLVDGLCRSLDIPATHIVIFTMKAFAAAVDSVGGVVIDNPTPVRDLYSGLDLTRTGPVRLDGVQLLALVRSRHPQLLTDGRWVSVSPTSGDADRTRSIALAFAALATKAGHDRHDPLALQELAWAVTQGLTADRHTGLTSLFDAPLRVGSVVSLPDQVIGADGIGATPDEATTAALRAAGYTQRCLVRP